ncbi:MAG: hypothetical protein WC254_01215 [Candidatus Woesearchaeota archaeon]
MITEKTSDGWSILGKGVVVVSLLAGVGAGIYFAGKELYDNGFEAGQRQGTTQQKEISKTELVELTKTHDAKIKQYQEKGLLLPETACLRYKSDLNHETYVGTLGCPGVTMNITKSGPTELSAIELIVGNKGVSVNPKYRLDNDAGWLSAYYFQPGKKEKITFP